MIGGFLDGETDNEKEYSKAEPDIQAFGVWASQTVGGCQAAGMNESRYLRELIVHGGVDATHAEDRRNLIRQSSGIATNINQMA